MGIREDSCNDIRVISPRLRNWGCLTSGWGTLRPFETREMGRFLREVANCCYKSMWKMPPSFLQRNSHNDRSLENIWCTSLLPEHPVIFCPFHAGAIDLWPMQTFFCSSWFFVFGTVAAFAALAAARASRSNQILDGFRRGAIGIHLSNDQRAGWGVVQPSEKPGFVGDLPWVQDCLGGWK